MDKKGFMSERALFLWKDGHETLSVRVGLDEKRFKVQTLLVPSWTTTISVVQYTVLDGVPPPITIGQDEVHSSHTRHPVLGVTHESIPPVPQSRYLFGRVPRVRAECHTRLRLSFDYWGLAESPCFTRAFSLCVSLRSSVAHCGSPTKLST